MKTIFRSTLLVSVIALALFSCKDDDKDNGPSKTDLIIAKPWKLTALTVGGVNFFDLQDDCGKDDIYTYNKNGKITVNEGSQKCDNAAPQTSEGTWVFESNETKLKVVLDGDTETSTLEELTATTLKLSYELDGVSWVFTFTAQ
jgi:Lipocalin-like domain